MTPAPPQAPRVGPSCPPGQPGGECPVSDLDPHGTGPAPGRSLERPSDSLAAGDAARRPSDGDIATVPVPPHSSPAAAESVTVATRAGPGPGHHDRARDAVTGGPAPAASVVTVASGRSAGPARPRTAGKSSRGRLAESGWHSHGGPSRLAGRVAAAGQARRSPSAVLVVLFVAAGSPSRGPWRGPLRCDGTCQ